MGLHEPRTRGPFHLSRVVCARREHGAHHRHQGLPHAAGRLPAAAGLPEQICVVPRPCEQLEQQRGRAALAVDVVLAGQRFVQEEEQKERISEKL